MRVTAHPPRGAKEGTEGGKARAEAQSTYETYRSRALITESRIPGLVTSSVTKRGAEYELMHSSSFYDHSDFVAKSLPSARISPWRWRAASETTELNPSSRFPMAPFRFVRLHPFL
eukprot:4732454-Prymnesium_polylepis.2